MGVNDLYKDMGGMHRIVGSYDLCWKTVSRASGRYVL